MLDGDQWCHTASVVDQRGVQNSDACRTACIKAHLEPKSATGIVTAGATGASTAPPKANLHVEILSTW